VFAIDGPELPIGPLSFVTPVTVSKEPMAVEMNADGTARRCRRRCSGERPWTASGGIEYAGAAVHATCRH
jgi:hypothetical protein